MDSSIGEPPNKKSKTNDARCCKCENVLRKNDQRSFKIINTKDEAEKFSKTYDFYVQPNDILCSKCFSKLRNIKFIRFQNINTADHTLSDQIPTINESEQSQNDEELSSNLSQVSIDQNETKTSDTQSSQTFNQFSQESSNSSISSNKKSSDFSSYHPTDQSSPEETEYIIMPFQRVITTKAKCFICKRKNSIIDVPLEARLQVFKKRRLFIPNRNRCCPDHLIKNRFFENLIPTMYVYSPETIIEAEEIKKFIDLLSDQVDIRLHDNIGTYSLSEERIKAFTGHSWNQILMIQNMLKSMRQSQNRNITQALVIFLFKLRSGNSNALISAILEVSENVVQDSIHSILKCFTEEVLPNNFGTAAHNRDFFLQEQTKAAGILYNLDDTLFVICDGTYLRHEKSSNNTYQRKSYSGQKKTPLCKPFTICTTNGYIIDLAGPFEGTVNDAQILKLILQDPNGLSSILKKGDVFILDRGFRDVVSFLEEKGFKVLMPALKGKRNQLTTEESNESRYVTKLRWVVEAKHGIIGQKYKLLHHQFSNKLLPSAGTYCKIACFIENMTGKRLNSDEGKLTLILERMMSQKNVENHLAEIVEDCNYNKKSVPFQKISSSDLLDFPELTVDELELFFTGSYQLKQAISYLGEMLDDDNTLNISFLKADPEIVRFEVQSRHMNRKTYKCYIQYHPNGEGINAIKGYCCTCANGLRTIGCCSHVAALLYHLSYGRYLSDVIRPAEILTNLFNINNVYPVIDEDSDED